MKGVIVILIVFFIVFFIFSGCDKGTEESITGNYFNRKPGELMSVTVNPDSIRIQSVFNAIIGNNEKTLSGRYKNISAFSVFKFSKPRQSILDSLVSAKLTFTVRESWREGENEFGLFQTTSSWSDTTLLDPDMFLPELGSPISVAADTAQNLVSIDFSLDADVFSSWGEDGSFLLKNTDSGMSMVSIASDNSSNPPSKIGRASCRERVYRLV
jgi:hypothetical protein